MNKIIVLALGIFLASDVFAHGVHAEASGAAHGFIHGVMSFGLLLAGILVALGIWAVYKRTVSREKE